MLYGNESISHYTPSNVAVWMSMSFQAGLLNIGGLMACHNFVSHITGYGTLFGLQVSRSEFGHALALLLVPLFFLCGSMISGQLVDIRLKLHRKPKYYITFGLIFSLMLLVFIGGQLGYFGIFGETLTRPRDYLLLAILCLLCGIQNGTITSVSRSVIRTTHLTGITTDLGIGIVRFLNRDKLQGEISDEVHANLMRLGIIFFFGFGSVVGGLVFSRFGYGGFLVPALTSGTLFGAALYLQVFGGARAR